MATPNSHRAFSRVPRHRQVTVRLTGQDARVGSRRRSDLLVRSDQVGPRPGERRRPYLETLNLYRVLACAAVVANHAFIWSNMSTNVVGTGFITILHLSRYTFFFLSGLVVVYSQLAHPRALREFWKRRYVQLGVPYLAWTAIYLVFALITVSAAWDEVGRFLRHNILLGYSQLYAASVIFQFYLVAPALLWLLRSTRRHAAIMAASLLFAFFLDYTLLYPSWFPALSGVERTMNSVLPWGRDLLAYQEFFVAGALVAVHFDEVSAFVSRHQWRILGLGAAIGGLTVLWYAVLVHTGTSLVTASNPVQAPAVIWFFAAIAAMFALSQWWEQRRRVPSGSVPPLGVTTCAGLAALTGGVWFCHNLFLTSLRTLLETIGVWGRLPWEAIVTILFVVTVVVSVAFVSLVLRTPLRWVLGGPVRAEQRAEYAQDLARPGPVALRPIAEGEPYTAVGVDGDRAIGGHRHGP